MLPTSFKAVMLRSAVVLLLGTAHITLSQPTLEPRAYCAIPANEDGSDDSPAILSAFKSCARKGHIVFENKTYHIHKTLKTTNLKDTRVDIHGTLLWGNNTDYWLKNPQETGFQNGSAAWFLGGSDVQVNGFGYGTLDGNGQVWYDLVKGESMYPDRPHALAIWNADGMKVNDLRMVQSQMWSMAIMWSKNVVLDNVYISSSTSSKNPARNTDGADTINSDNITFRNMYIRNGDDAIAIKGNSTNILVEDSTFEKSLGLAFGSLGQYGGAFERVENVVARRIRFLETRHGSYIKTWTGDRVSYPPNGGGGGVGYLRNVSLIDFDVEGLRNQPFSVAQCTSFSGERGDCESSEFKISNIELKGWSGTTASGYVVDMDCSKASGGCKDITVEDMDLKNKDTDDKVDRYRCRDL
ncbi:hypothetical protein FSARC_14253 [Fusarium sarcochroum]|uniref:Uncharacterized protein n=1 Tax=Fusarium sarcochroum TaxID=1208366 RepID=A0A8H4WQ75_9HYPO|nr:hypothetical protein FSARC_14253 [Fusarium sarcochroum]